MERSTMPDAEPAAILLGLRILVVEDEYMVADELRRDLAEHGVEVVGPAAKVSEVLRFLAVAGTLDGAVLDVNLGGEMVFPVADLLRKRGVPFVLPPATVDGQCRRHTRMSPAMRSL
jgi:DNA-binding LytR/AlgR family response regulator